MYIVRLEDGGSLSNGVWLAQWEGDPGRTLRKHNAERFKDIGSAEKALTKAREYRQFKNARIEEL